MTAHVLRDASTPSAPIRDTTTYVLDSHGWVNSVTDPDNWVTNFTYYPSGTVHTQVRQIDASHWATTSWTYDAWGNVLTEIDPDGITTTNTYTTDGFHNLATQVVSGTVGPAVSPITTAYAYDSGHRLCLTIENPTMAIGSINCATTVAAGAADVNVASGFTYYATNQIEDQTNPLGVVTHHVYDSYGNQYSVTKNYKSGGADDSTNVTTSYGYDIATGDVTSETDPIELATSSAVTSTTKHTYNDFGQVTSEIDPGDASVLATKLVNTYDEFGTKTSSANYICSTSGATCPDLDWVLLNTSQTAYYP